MMEDFEKEIKKHFQERQIKPSENAWNKMQTLLDEQQPKQKTPKKLFYFLSAAVSVLLFVGLWTFFQKVDHSLPETKPRSEEHTSELQSRPHLVCRLLLEKK